MDILIYLLSFITILSAIVFIHEYGHYIIAKKCGVKIESFSIGFGKELFGWHDKHGTRWKISLIPLGGYVKMYGDENAASMANNQKLTPQQQKQAFAYKPVYQKFLIVLAGPAANFLLGIIIMFFLLTKFGISTSSNIVAEVVNELPADIAGLKNDDRIIAIDGKKISDFNDIQQIIQISPDITLNVTVERNKELFVFSLTPQAKTITDFLGNETKTGYIGIKSGKTEFKEVGLIAAVPLSVSTTWDITTLTLKVLKQLIMGQRELSDLSGPVKIAQYSGQVTKKSFTKDDNGERNIYLLFWFIAMLSINLGLMNLLPIPVLDGGHILLYSIELIIRRPIPYNIQKFIFALGFSFLILLFIVITLNDIKSVIGG